MQLINKKRVLVFVKEKCVRMECIYGGLFFLCAESPTAPSSDNSEEAQSAQSFCREVCQYTSG